MTEDMKVSERSENTSRFIYLFPPFSSSHLSSDHVSLLVSLARPLF